MQNKKIDTNHLLTGSNMAEFYHQNFLVFYTPLATMSSSTSKYVISSFREPAKSSTTCFCVKLCEYSISNSMLKQNSYEVKIIALI